MEKDRLVNPDFETVPHEIYRVRRDTEGRLYDLSNHPISSIRHLTVSREVQTFQNPQEAKNIIRETRHFTDFLNPWAAQRGSDRL